MKVNLPRSVELAAFATEINRPDDQINLARAVLQMGRFEYPDLNIGLYEQRVKELADDALRFAGGESLDPLQLAEYLFDRLGYRGNNDNYMDPRNSYLNEVLERHLGIPISLSVLYIAVARELGIEAVGIGLPGHFIIRVQDSRKDANQSTFLDPFHRGVVMSPEDCRKLVEKITSGSVPFTEAYLNPVGVRYILIRMLNNLKNVYAKSKDFSRARHVVERLLVVNPENSEEIRNLGLLYSALGLSHRAVELLEAYLEANPNAADAESVKAYAVSLSQNLARWN